MGITVGGARGIFGLQGCLLSGTHGGIAHRMDAVIQTLAQLLDLGNTVQILAGQQTAQVAHQLFEFCLGGGNGFGYGGHTGAFQSRKQR